MRVGHFGVRHAGADERGECDLLFEKHQAQRQNQQVNRVHPRLATRLDNRLAAHRLHVPHLEHVITQP